MTVAFSYTRAVFYMLISYQEYLLFQFVPESPLWCTVIQFEVERKEGFYWLKHYQGPEMSVTFSNMLPGQQYHIRVRALSIVKPYPFSSILVTTKAGGKFSIHMFPLCSNVYHEKLVPISHF
jgi:hypothetical protein